MSDERATKDGPPAAFCSESVATIDTVKRPYCPRNPCAFFAALQGKRCALVNHTGGNGVWHGRRCEQSWAASRSTAGPARRNRTRRVRTKGSPKPLVAQAAHTRRLAKGSQRVRMSAHRAFLSPPPRPAGIAWISSVSIFG